MKILYVCSNISIPGNGISTSARNISAALREAGEDVRILAGENSDPDGIQPEFRLKRYKFPIFQPIITANGFCFAERDYGVIEEAVRWADIVHIEEPFPLEKTAIDYAEKMGKPIVGTYHLYTQNILSEIPLASLDVFNNMYTNHWRKKYFDHMSHIQCPSQVVKDLLIEKGFKAKLHVISNGITIPEERVIAKPWTGGPYRIIMIGRLARIKKQGELLDAMHHSRHAKEIQLEFAGNGMREKWLKTRSMALYKTGYIKYKPIFSFKDKEGLKELAGDSYLVVHAAKMEVEGLGCVEALREGTVPMIAQGPLIGTSGFAIDDRSLFPSGNSKVLAEKIDWWIEHPEERNRMAQQYADKARDYDIKKSAQALIEMYGEALRGE